MKDFNLEDIEDWARNFIPHPIGNDFLDARYNWQKNKNGVEWPYYRFFYHLANKLEPDLTVELGGYQGSCAAHLADGWPLGRVFTVDHHTDPGDEHNKVKMIDCYEEFANLEYIQGWSTDKLAEENKGKHALGDAVSVYAYIKYCASKIDILFIDSWHNYEYAKADYATYLPLMNSPGLIICDDIMDGNEPGPISGMMKFWHELPEPKFLNNDLHPGCEMGFLKV